MKFRELHNSLLREEIIRTNYYFLMLIQNFFYLATTIRPQGYNNFFKIRPNSNYNGADGFKLNSSGFNPNIRPRYNVVHPSRTKYNGLYQQDRMVYQICKKPGHLAVECNSKINFLEKRLLRS